MKIINCLGMFLLGLSDSLSLKWITGILFYTNPKTNSILKMSIELQKTLAYSLLQAGLILTIIPLSIKYLGFQTIYWIITAPSLLFTYGYLIFYNSDVTTQTKEIILWKHSKYPDTLQELDRRQRFNFLTDISNQIQSFIFEMVYYTPMNLLLIVITIFDQRYSPILLVIMDSFFNAAFYFFRKWPYDKYNVAYLEKNLSYCLGYGFFVSLATNIILPSTMSIGAYLLLSQWMIINAMLHSPPEFEFTSLQQIIKILTNSEERRKLTNGYNVHRRRLRQNPEYGKNLFANVYFMRSFFKLTDKINNKLSKFFDVVQINRSDHSPETEPNLKEKETSSVIEEKSSNFNIEQTGIPLISGNDAEFHSD